MFSYRCFVLDRTGHIAERLSIECDNDGDAIVRAGAILERREGMTAIEVWDGARLVQKLNRIPAIAEPLKPGNALPFDGSRSKEWAVCQSEEFIRTVPLRPRPPVAFGA